MRSAILLLLSVFVLLLGCSKKEHPCKTELGLKAADAYGVAGYAYEPTNPKIGKVIAIYDQIEDPSDADQSLFISKLKTMVGLIGIGGEEILPPLYKSIAHTSNSGLRAFQKFGLSGYFGSDWKVRIEPTYESGRDFVEGYAVVKKDGKFGIIDTSGKSIVPFQYEEIRDYSNGMAAFSVEGEYGFFNTKGEAVILPQFKWVTNFQEGVAIGDLEGATVLLNQKGEFIGPPGTNIDKRFYSRFFKTKKNGKFGVVDSFGKVILPAEFDALYSNSKETIFFATQGTLHGAFDATGKPILPLEYSSIGYVDKYADLIFAKKAGTYFLINSEGKLKKVPQIAEPMVFERNYAFGYIKFYNAAKQGLLDSEGEVVLPGEYDRIEMDAFYRYWRLTKGKKTFLFTPERAVYPVEEDNWFDFSEGFARIGSSQYRYGFLDAKGKLAIPKIFEEVYSFSEGLAAAKKPEEKWGYIDKSGNFVIDPKFDSISSFHNGLAIVGENKKFGVIDSKGNYVVPLTFEEMELSSRSPGVYTVTISGKKGILSLRACSGL